MDRTTGGKRRVVRSLFVSDVHLGCRHSQADAFLLFLRQYQPRNLYFVGDFIDGWKLRRRWRWSPAYDGILKHLLALRESGTKLFYTPGNHDGFLRTFLEQLGPVKLVSVSDWFLHESPGKRRFLVTHGDQLDRVEQHARWLSLIASIGYDVLLSANWVASRLHGNSNDPYALCKVVKRQVKRLVRHISEFEEQLIGSARLNKCNGVICGHIHTPRIKRLGDLVYFNTGDWVENCSALIEHEDGAFELVQGDGTVLDSLPAPEVLELPAPRQELMDGVPLLADRLTTIGLAEQVGTGR